MGLTDRGVLWEGLAADIVIFDLEKIDDVVSWDDPTAKPVGIEYVVVYGQLVLDDGRHTKATPGEVLRGPGYKG